VAVAKCRAREPTLCLCRIARIPLVFDAKAEQTFLQWSKEITLLNGVFQGKDQLTQRDLQSAELGDKSWKLSCSDDRPPALAVKTSGAVFALRSG